MIIHSLCQKFYSPRFRLVLTTLALLLCPLFLLITSVIAFPYPTEQLTTQSPEPLIFLDRHGQPLRRIATEDGRRYAWTRIDQIPTMMLLAVLSSEDKNFYEHSGVDPIGIIRAAWLNIIEQRWGYGGSTLTMQLARMIHSSGESRTLVNKLRESWYALRLEQALSKKEIFEHYLNRAYFGRGAYGVEAASQLYFGKPIAALSDAESLSIAVILRSPALYDPIRHLDTNLRRRKHIIGLMNKNGLITNDQIRNIESQNLSFTVHPPEFHAPHFVDWLLSQTQNNLASLKLELGGQVKTTLDLHLQKSLQHRVTEHVESMKAYGMTQAGAVVLDAQTNEILAMVGSADYNGKEGKMNITTWRVYPGSALKPFVYAIALENGSSPASIVLDIHDRTSKILAPQTAEEHGPSRFRAALGGSFNLSAIRVLENIGVASLVNRLRASQAGTLPGDVGYYNMGLALGSTKVELLKLASAYDFLVKDGFSSPPKSVIKIERKFPGSIEPETLKQVTAKPEKVFTKEVSWLVMDMLSDPQPRRPVFGQELPLDLPFKIAVKTGTAQGLSSTVTIGVTNEYIVAAWAGNFDGSPTHGLVSMQTAAPIVRTGFELVSKGKNLTLPEKPLNIIEKKICPLSGMLLSEHCSNQKIENFSLSNLPKETCDWHQTKDGKPFIQYPPELREWLEKQNTSASQ